MATNTYRRKDGQKVNGFVPGAGEVVDGVITVPDGIVFENAAFEKAETQVEVKTTPVAPVVVQPAPQTPTVNQETK
jgi:hypothetical protein